MLALVFDKKPELVEIEDSKAAEGEALIAVEAAGICRTDIEITQGYMEFRGVLGHEFAGSVLECGSVPDLVGKRVVGEINIAPGVTDDLARRHAPDRSVIGIWKRDGCFAERISMPVENLHVAPSEVDAKSAVFVEPVAASLEILEQLHVRPVDRVVVVGDGKLGLLVVQVLRLTGCELLLVGKHESKLKIARSFGVETELLEDVGKERFDIVVDCSGRPEGLQTSLSLTRPRGTLVLKSTTAIPPDFDPSQIVVDEITIVGSCCGPFPPAIRLLADNLVGVEPLIEAIYPLSKGIEALEHAARPGALKVLLEMDRNTS